MRKNTIEIEIIGTKQVKNWVKEENQKMNIIEDSVNNEAIKHETEIVSRMKKELEVDGLLAFSFKACNDGVLVSSYIEGEFCEKYLLYVIEGALHYHDFVEERRGELEDAEYRNDIFGSKLETF